MCGSPGEIDLITEEWHTVLLLAYGRGGGGRERERERERASHPASTVGMLYLIACPLSALALLCASASSGSAETEKEDSVRSSRVPRFYSGETRTEAGDSIGALARNPVGK